MMKAKDQHALNKLYENKSVLAYQQYRTFKGRRHRGIQ